MQKKTDSEHYYVIKSGKIRIESIDKIAWTLDGEFGGEHNIAQIENINNAVKIAVAQ